MTSHPTTPTPPPRILLVDDEPDMLGMLSNWLMGTGFDVTVASDGYQALGLLQAGHFDLVVTDMKMPGLTGLQLLNRIKELDAAIEVVVLTGHATLEDAIAALREGRAYDFLQKPLENMADLNATIERALARRRSTLRRQTAPLSLPNPIEALSRRELDVVALLAQGHDNRQIANTLFLSEKTVKNHLTRIFEKLQVQNRTHALVVCQQLGLLEA